MPRGRGASAAAPNFRTGFLANLTPGTVGGAMLASSSASKENDDVQALRNELAQTRALLDRQQQLFPKLAEQAARADEFESEATSLRHSLLEEQEDRRSLADQVKTLTRQYSELKEQHEMESHVRTRDAASSAAELEAAKTLLDSAAAAAARAEGECLSLRSAL